MIKNIDVLIRPKISAAKNQEHVIHGQQAVLKCLADGIPRPEIKWFKDNAAIDKSSTDFLITKNGEELHLGIKLNLKKKLFWYSRTFRKSKYLTSSRKFLWPDMAGSISVLFKFFQKCSRTLAQLLDE